MRFSPLGDSAIVAEWGESISSETLQRVGNFAAAVARASLPAVIDIVPAFATVTVFYDPAKLTGSAEMPHARMCRELTALSVAASPVSQIEGGKEVAIPVCYGGEFGPDLVAVAEHAGLSVDGVIALHSAAGYQVNAIGFSPGFPYLGGLPEKLHMPRLSTPRTAVPAGSVGIGGAQTGIYPLATPGGWQLIGRTPLQLFNPARGDPALLRIADRVKFQPITADDYRRIKETCHPIDDKPAGRITSGGGSTCHLIDDKEDNFPGVKILHAGMFTTVQDLGRRGHRAGGVPLGGAVDAMALRVANWLVGNTADAAALEFTLVGPELEFTADTVVALGGAAFGGFPRWQPLRMAAGTRLKFEAAREGCRGYLAVAGGFDLAPVLGSRSTYSRANLGGFQGRALRDGDILRIAGRPRQIAGRWRIDERILPAYSAAPTVRVVRGGQASEFFAALLATEFTVTPRSDRMGIRLSGFPPGQSRTTELLSTAVTPGTIQMPGDGQPIVLMADAQTIGGYPQAAHVITVDLPLMGQLRPGERLRFREVSLEEAQKLLLAREHALAILHEGLVQKFS